MSGSFRFSCSKYTKAQTIRVQVDYYDLEGAGLYLEGFTLELKIVEATITEPSFSSPLKKLSVKQGEKAKYVLP